jgi:hypothetical protein
MKRTSVLLIAALAALGCDEGTTGRPVLLHTRLVTDLPADHTVTTSLGWTVTLKKATVATGPLYYFDGEPAFTRRTAGAKRFLAWLAPVGTAHAHPGHYAAGRATGQVLAPHSADLLAGPTTLPDGNGITGLYRSATFSFAAPGAGPAAAQLAGHVAVTEGVASKDGKTVYFVLTADLADVARTAKDGAVAGCGFQPFDVAADGTVTVTVRPRVWFNLVDFSLLAPGTPEAPTVAAPGSVPHIAFALGLAQLSAYQFAYTTP